MTNTSNLNYFLESGPDFFFSYNLKRQRFQYVNPALKEFLIRDQKTSVKQLLNLIHIDDRAYIKQIYGDLKSGLFREAVEFRITIGQHIHFLKLNAVVDSQHSGHLMGHIQNITQEKTYITKLVEFTNKKNAILEIVSHDLREPLGAIQMLSGLLKSRINKSKPEIEKIISMIDNNCKNGLQMVRDFIKKEFLESIGVEAGIRRTNIVSNIEQLIEEYKSSELHTHLNFKFKCLYSEIYVMADESKFRQAINNLISNAVKFTPDGGTIAVNMAVEENNLLIEVADTGIGIPKRFHSNLFDKFNLAGRTGLKGENSVGLGMSVIKTIIEWHKGKIWFESEENEGTSFFIELNVVPDTD